MRLVVQVNISTIAFGVLLLFWYILWICFHTINQAYLCWIFIRHIFADQGDGHGRWTAKQFT